MKALARMSYTRGLASFFIVAIPALNVLNTAHCSSPPAPPSAQGPASAPPRPRHDAAAALSPRPAGRDTAGDRRAWRRFLPAPVPALRVWPAIRRARAFLCNRAWPCPAGAGLGHALQEFRFSVFRIGSSILV